MGQIFTVLVKSKSFFLQSENCLSKFLVSMFFTLMKDQIIQIILGSTLILKYKIIALINVIAGFTRHIDPQFLHENFEKKSIPYL